MTDNAGVAGRGELGSAKGMAVTGAARMAKRLGVLAWGLWALAMLGLAGLVLDAARKGGAHLG